VSDAQRLFVGVKVSMSVVGDLSSAVETLARRAQLGGLRVRWVAPASYHVTLKFLGWTRPETVSALEDGLGRAVAGIPPFAFRTERLGAFPSPERATVVWAGIDDRSGALVKLAEAVDREMAQLGFEPEKRRFHPHVTLGRLRDPGDVSQVLLPLSEQVFSETRAAEVHLFESQMKSKGSEYATIAKIALETASDAAKRQTATVQRPSFDTSKGPGDRASSDVGSGTDDGWGEEPRG
jgi:RNA 2',3'-cyclic 3'-phosphodiesterase